MTIYIILLLVLTITCMINSTTGGIIKLQKNSDKVYWFLIISMLLLQSLRAKTVGGDLFDSYAALYEACGKISLRNTFSYSIARGYEVGYIVLNKICYSVSNGNLQFLLAVVAAIYILPLARILNKYSANRFLGLFIFVASYMFNMSMNNLRSAIANGIILLFLPFLIEKKYVKFMMGIGLASLFHQTSFVFLFFFITVLITNKYILIVSYALAGLFFTIGYSLVAQLIANYLPRYSSYLANESNGGFTFLAFLSFLAIIVAVLSQPKFWENKNNIIIYKMLVCGLLLQIISLRSPFFVRAVYYHLISLPIILPALLKENRLAINSKAFLYFAVMIGFWIYFVFFLNVNNTCTVPYEFFFT